MIRSVKPSLSKVYSIDEKPALLYPTCLFERGRVRYILCERVPRKHYVVVDGKELREGPNAVRVSRYLYIVDDVIREKNRVA